MGEKIVFSDEKIFTVERKWNAQKNRIWSCDLLSSILTTRKVARVQKLSLQTTKLHSFFIDSHTDQSKQRTVYGSNFGTRPLSFVQEKLWRASWGRSSARFDALSHEAKL